MKAKLKKNQKVISQPVEELLGEILAPNTDDGIGTDNMTCILIVLKNDGIS
jgi:serine/threonine protein phosphatase PrpC